MKICATVAEYNPFHNGHFYHISQIRQQSGCDKVLCILSGNFTQRGEIAVLDKYTRARHAILAGADIVIELPTVFATSNAEIFAKGAIKILQQIPSVTTLSFGAETGDKTDFLAAAAALNNESKEFKSMLKSHLKTGKSLVRAKTDIIKELKPEGVDLNLLDNPNTILGLEYAKALQSLGANINLLPIKRIGSGYNDTAIAKNFSSASAIRGAFSAAKKRMVKKNLPKFVYSSLSSPLPNADNLIYYSLLTSSAQQIAQVLDCSEGLENRIKALLKDNLTLSGLIDKIVTKRYTKARIRRICLQNFLQINSAFIEKALASNLYIKVLAISKNSLDLLPQIKNSSPYPLITRKSDYETLSGFAASCFEKDILANDIFNFVSGKKTNEFIMPVIDN